MAELYSFPQIEKEAEAIVAAARERARLVLAEAAKRLAEIRKIAREEGFAEGHQAGLEKGRAEAAGAFRKETETGAAALRAVAEQWETARREFLERAEQDAAAMAMKVAERVVQGAVEADPAAVVRIVRRAVELAVDRQRIEVRLHPRDRRAIEEHLPDLKSRFFDLAEVGIVEDPSIPPGGAVVRTRSGEVDARLETMLGEIRGALFGGAGEAGDARVH